MSRTPLVPSDLYTIVMHGAPRISSSNEVYFVQTVLDREKDAARSHIRRARPGEASSAFTAGPKDGLPSLSPGGETLAFVSDRGDGARVYVIPTGGGESLALTAVYNGIAAIEWSPAGDRIGFVATAPHDPKTAGSFHDVPSGARHIRRLPFKSDSDGLLDGTRKHLFIIGKDGGDATQVTAGDFDVQSFAWSPDGRAVAVSALIDRSETSFSPDLHLIDIQSGERRKLTPSDGPSSAPSFSHDGKTIAFIGNQRGDLSGGRFNAELCLVPAAGGEIVSLTASFDRSLGDWIVGDLRGGFGVAPPVWSGDDSELILSVCSEGASSIRAFRTDGAGMRTIIDGERHIIAFDRNSAGSIALVESTPIEPSRVVVCDANGERPLTFDNAWLEERSIRSPRRLRPAAADGTKLDAWILDPDETAHAPLVLEVHGGPHAAYGYSFFFEFQMLASLGFGVAYGNPRGGQSYGEGYSDAITGRWGELDAADVLSILDAVEAAGDWDTARVGIAGGSYGGFMTTWLLGHSKRFAAGVSMRAVNEFLTEYTASDINIWIGSEIGAGWEDAGAGLFERSPMRAAAAIEAALLVEHSERDYRCPIDQADSLFTLLRSLGRTNVEYVRFTGDGHELSRTGKPRNRVLRLRAIAQWFIRHLKPAGIEPAPDEAGALFAPLPGEAEAV